jgi:hypothetical protein
VCALMARVPHGVCMHAQPSKRQAGGSKIPIRTPRASPCEAASVDESPRARTEGLERARLRARHAGASLPGGAEANPTRYLLSGHLGRVDGGTLGLRGRSGLGCVLMRVRTMRRCVSSIQKLSSSSRAACGDVETGKCGRGPTLRCGARGLVTPRTQCQGNRALGHLHSSILFQHFGGAGEGRARRAGAPAALHWTAKGRAVPHAFHT